MKTQSFYTCAAGAAALMLLGVGCKSKTDTGLTQIPPATVVTKTITERVPFNPNPNPGLPPGNPFGNGGGTTGTDNGNPTGWPTDPTAGLAIPYDFKRDLFQRVQFDYDSSVLRAGDVVLVQTVATSLQANPTHLLLVEGHCDERGTEEYNLSLGERRAIAVVEELVRLGINPQRMRPQTFGEKVKVDEADTTAAHAKNRRGEFVLVVPKTVAAPLPAKRIDFGPGQ
jgi:peptidoglycan-associated lipoprotein